MSSPKRAKREILSPKPSPRSSPKKKNEPVIGYVHNLSSLRKGQKCKWFDMQLQTAANKRVRAVCFSKEKYNIFVEKEKTITPVKISNYLVGPTWDGSGEEEIRINDMTVVQVPASSEYSFQYLADEEKEGKITPLSVVLSESEIGSFVNIKGKFTKGSTPEVVGRNNLNMLKCALTDNTDALPITIWEDEIQNVEDGFVYQLHNVGVRVRDHSKFLTTTPTTRFIKEEGDALEQLDDSSGLEMLLPPLDTTMEIESIRSVDVEKFRSCVQCSAKIPPAMQTNILKCLRCGHRMRFDNCEVMVACKITILAEDHTDTVLSLTVFSEVIEKSLRILDVSSLSEDQIAEKLLLLEKLNISFDSEEVVTKIEQCQ